MKTLLFPILLCMCFCAALPAFAIELNDAKVKGLVGEQRDGMLGAVSAATPEVLALVNEINAKRAKAYAGIARQNGADIEIVKQLAGKKAIEKTPAGQYVKPADRWVLVR